MKSSQGFDEYETLPGQLNFIDFLEEFNKAKEVDIRGICDDGYCPNCGASLDDLVSECDNCHQKLSWERWKKLNES